MKRAYKPEQAERLQPLLESIARELDERSIEIKGLSQTLRRQRETGADEDALANTIATLANAKRELRHAMEELEALGCAAEPGFHTTILIPGPDGDLDTGYRLDARGQLAAAELEAA